ncbi:MAG: hypothetical protein JRI46_05095 [Deltaproteobacteria bacterium]|nr:hypothetical protein [Deltaproteobacteria bacterium]
MRKRYITSKTFLGLVFLIVLGLVLGCAGMMYKPSGPVSCATKIKWNVTKEADVTFLNCYIRQFKGWKKPVWHFEVGIKNKSDKPQRFRVQFILPEEGVASGGLLPRKGKPPVLAPGKEAKGTYPVNCERAPKKVTVVVKTISIK